MPVSDDRRLFLALWPSADIRHDLVAMQRHFPPEMGRAVISDNLHITLVFLGATPTERRDCIETALSGVEKPSFNFELNQVGYWRKPQVLWAGSDDVAEPLTSLVDAITRIVVGCGCKLDPRPFHPHLTLFRKVRRPPRNVPKPAPIQWHADSFVMVESVTAAEGVIYKVLRTWALAPGSVSG